MRIRPATPADVPAILPMVAALCAQHEAWDPERYGYLPGVVERYRRWLPQRAADPRSVLLIAEDAGTERVVERSPGSGAIPLAGFLVGTVEANIPIYTLTEFGFIHDMWVDPAQRRRGIARALVLAAVERFRAMGVSQVRLETATANEGARRLFESCGFRIGAVDMLRVIG